MKSKFLCFILIISMMILINGVAAININEGSLIHAIGLEVHTQVVQIVRTKLLFQLAPTTVVAPGSIIAEEASSH
ncbi:hypothetical protein CFP56_023672 [Quercus suber]|uniref:Secreted protein n=1 Tax=Quercus suber TaxID=58331 RepID=A0AAW0LYM2_QUESU|nr:hypothetical protein CFP56_69418 [Quercus suber]